MPRATQRQVSLQRCLRQTGGSTRRLRGSNHLGRQGRLAFMAWVSGLFSPSGFSPLEPPFPSNLSFAATHSNFCGTPLTSFIFQEISYSLPQPFSAGGSFHLFCHTPASAELVIGISGHPAKDCPERHKGWCLRKVISDGQADRRCGFKDYLINGVL